MRFLTIPLPDNTKTGWSCGEVAVISALEYLNIEPRLTEESARKLTHKIPTYNTWPEQLIRIAFIYPTVSVTIYRSKLFSFPIHDYICSQYEEVSAERLLKETDVNDLEDAIKECENNNQCVIKNITLETILGEVRPGKVVIVWVCFDTLYGPDTAKGFNAHYVIVTGFDPDNVYVHECGGLHSRPEANKPIQRGLFMKALDPDPNFMVWASNIQG